jgi:hypothetical protein
MKNTSISLIALGVATTALFAFTPPAHTTQTKSTGKDSVLIISTTDSAAFTDSLAVKDSIVTDSAFREGPCIKGKIEPADAASEVWAISGVDSTKATITGGTFQLNEKPGTYKVVVVATGMYKTVIKDDVQVADGNATDLGTIKLEQ